MIVKNMQLKNSMYYSNEYKKEQEMTRTRIQICRVHLISSGATTLYKIYSPHQLLN